MASFVFYDLIFLIIFTLIAGIFLYRKRANLKRQGLLYLYRTKIGIKIMDWTVKRFGPILRPLEYVIIACGYALMVGMIWMLARFTYIYSHVGVAEQIKIPPLLPLFPYATDLFKVDFLPPFYFTYWILIIAIIAISHEFAHGIFARLHKIPVHSTGFGFLGPFLAAFVEPDEKKMQKASKFKQLSILAAGTFANVVMTVLFAIIFVAFFWLSFTPAGINFNTYPQALINTSDISAINGVQIDGLSEALAQAHEGMNKIESDGKTYVVPKSSLERAVDSEVVQMVVFEDAPAVNANLTGPILEINEVKIDSRETLRDEIARYSPGDTIRVKTIEDGKETIKNIKLGEKDGRAYLGVGFIDNPRKGLTGLISNMISKVKDPSVYYEARYEQNFALFIYNLLWWTVLINISVALVNMLPVGIFDGGRFFYLTIWGITGSEKFGKRAFTFATWLIIAVLVWVMIVWAFAFF